MTLQEENEKLRGLLDRTVTEVGRTITPELRAAIEAALSQQTEPAPAQDGRAITEKDVPAYVWGEAERRYYADGYNTALSKQTEQQPTVVPEGWLIELGFDVLDRPFRFVDSKSHTPTIKVVLPPCEPDDSSSWNLRDEVAQRIGSVLAAPQPEQSRMAEALGAFVSLAEDRLHELGALSPEMSECLTNGRAALSAQEK